MANNTPALVFWRKIAIPYPPHSLELEEQDWDGIILVLAAKNNKIV